MKFSGPSLVSGAVITRNCICVCIELILLRTSTAS
ncbi:unnamed protein product [Schistosoma margrebowiei]|uniref:Uncharacterized protein n=1 Tax=Schistosoma margrebowiei TaxID=48269 RepID=A0A183LRH3_9TREM|nr:unnamed protein product [Schistosoma margrebowiei]